MTVAELIAALQKMPGDALVEVWAGYDGNEATEVKLDADDDSRPIVVIQ